MAALWQTIYQFIYQWQTLIAGIFAIIAGIITVRGTRRTAQIQIKESRNQIEQQQKHQQLQNELMQSQDRKFINEKLGVLYSDIKQKLKQIGQGNLQEQMHKGALEEIRRIPLLEMQDVEEKIARLDPSIISNFTKLRIDIRMFSENTDIATREYAKRKMDAFLEQIKKIRLQIRSGRELLGPSSHDL